MMLNFSLFTLIYKFIKFWWDYYKGSVSKKLGYSNSSSSFRYVSIYLVFKCVLSTNYMLFYLRYYTAMAYSSIQNVPINHKLGLKPLMSRDAGAADQPGRRW